MIVVRIGNGVGRLTAALQVDPTFREQHTDDPCELDLRFRERKALGDWVMLVWPDGA